MSGILSLVVAPAGHRARGDHQPAATARTGMSLDHGRRFRTGDAPRTERPGYDDTGWLTFVLIVGDAPVSTISATHSNGGSR